MNNPIRVILISQIALPYSKIGSWSTLYKNYLENTHRIDYIICPKPQKLFEGIQYHFAKLTFWHKLQRKFLRRKNLEYFRAFDKIIDPSQKYIIQIVDNYGMVKSLKKHLVAKGIAEQCYIQFFYHGFSPYVKSGSGDEFYEIIDEMVVLTMDSYKAHKKSISVLPSHFSILNNGIDTKRFKKVSEFEKNILKKELGFGDKITFVWCSQDRPKKGLDLILEVWRKTYSVEKKMQLLVIGCDPRPKMEGVVFLGKIANEELPKYYQASDCYLFPTLWQEGFGLSLIEALHCGNYCIASAFGGVPEVLQYGKLGKLIENPHFVSEWEMAINEFLEGNSRLPEFSDDLYAMENWNKGMNEIIEKAKSRLINREIIA
ncbi:glycosyltransferase family 4 protein [Flavobacterium poyangense]|uniref:glycosyltransferase family 4 protein n=1 Tax=Flavobacterium poyangense TaxID=2204302 RepID=UPI001423D642|nr:glycosyltransferase [Flavobacterium sp. JXAS1]